MEHLGFRDEEHGVTRCTFRRVSNWGGGFKALWL